MTVANDNPKTVLPITFSCATIRQAALTILDAVPHSSRHRETAWLAYQRIFDVLCEIEAAGETTTEGGVKR
jgi:hypothetical protein